MGIIGLICLILSISLHEIGHFIAMRRSKLDIKEVCLIGMGTKLFSFKVPYFRETDFTIRAFPIGASVRPSEYSRNRMSFLPLSEQCHIYSNGLRYNLYIASFMLALLQIYAGKANMLYIPLVMALVAYVSRWVHQVWSVVSIGSMIMLCINIINIIKGLTIFGTFSEVYVDSSNYYGLIKTMFMVNISFVLFNSLPMIPLDGARVIQAYIEHIYPNRKRRIRTLLNFTLLPIAMIILYACVSDIVGLIQWIFI
jgi:membrane-associated protease RseP (regulator of RpoE activity)